MKFRGKARKLSPWAFLQVSGVWGACCLAGRGNPGWDVPWRGSWCAAVAHFISQLCKYPIGTMEYMAYGGGPVDHRQGPAAGLDPFSTVLGPFSAG